MRRREGPKEHAYLLRLFGWLSQPAVLFFHIKSASATNHLLASSIFLSQQISTSHQPPTSRTS
jgi:hypothetical protein